MRALLLASSVLILASSCGKAEKKKLPPLEMYHYDFELPRADVVKGMRIMAGTTEVGVVGLHPQRESQTNPANVMVDFRVPRTMWISETTLSIRPPDPCSDNTFAITLAHPIDRAAEQEGRDTAQWVHLREATVARGLPTEKTEHVMLFIDRTIDENTEDQTELEIGGLAIPTDARQTRLYHLACDARVKLGGAEIGVLKPGLMKDGKRVTAYIISTQGPQCYRYSVVAYSNRADPAFGTVTDRYAPAAEIHPAMIDREVEFLWSGAPASVSGAAGAVRYELLRQKTCPPQKAARRP